ncbi:hypothetical protein AX774_g7875 [Zancudomyces culisetae]|uniref:Uncharacterized protein n=1 Tax=Zancudomyces culisetae TaxID=1213189 RepID=A0A1R1PCM5_ZANCU|nr:hypothetical protein AX774_g7875 [Zancudomyces culisetae]|eukprot:OMH78726.1 hypothetical protein AX774_g7875 [Zancudomyces culisetae]
MKYKFMIRFLKRDDSSASTLTPTPISTPVSTSTSTSTSRNTNEPIRYDIGIIYEAVYTMFDLVNERGRYIIDPRLRGSGFEDGCGIFRKAYEHHFGTNFTLEDFVNYIPDLARFLCRLLERNNKEINMFINREYYLRNEGEIPQEMELYDRREILAAMTRPITEEDRVHLRVIRDNFISVDTSIQARVENVWYQGNSGDSNNSDGGDSNYDSDEDTEYDSNFYGNYGSEYDSEYGSEYGNVINNDQDYQSNYEEPQVQQDEEVEHLMNELINGLGFEPCASGVIDFDDYYNRYHHHDENGEEHQEEEYQGSGYHEEEYQEDDYERPITPQLRSKVNYQLLRHHASFIQLLKRKDSIASISSIATVTDTEDAHGDTSENILEAYTFEETRTSVYDLEMDFERDFPQRNIGMREIYNKIVMCLELDFDFHQLLQRYLRW